MAFGGVQADNKGGPTGPGTFQIADFITGLTLAARVGATDPTGAAADTGILTTQQGVIANTNNLPSGFGRGPGKWQTTDANFVEVTIEFQGDLAGGQLPNVQVATKAITNGDLVLTFHNGGAGVTGAMRFFVKTLFPLVS